MSQGSNVMAAEAFGVDWVTAVCMTILLYDSIITFDREVNTIWNLKFSIPKILFFLNRYVVVGMLVFNAIASSQTHLAAPFCVFYLRWLTCTLTVTITVVEGILVARVYALYKGNIFGTMFALALYFVSVGVLVSLTVVDYVSEKVDIVNDFAELPGCYASSVPGMIAGYWISPLIAESVFFFMVIRRAAGWWRNQTPAPPTLVLLARDSAIYFLVIFVLLFVNLFVFEYGPPFLSSMMVTPSNTAGCIAGSRMLLNMRRLVCHDDFETDVEMSNLRFMSEPKDNKDTAVPRDSDFTGTDTVVCSYSYT